MLTLTGNKISYIDKEFVSNTPNVRYIYMGENELKTIESGTLKQFSQVCNYIEHFGIRVVLLEIRVLDLYYSSTRAL